MKRVFIGLLFFCFFVFFQGLSYALEIVVSNSPLEKIVEEIVPDCKVYQLQSEKQDFHSFEPTLSQWLKIKKADLVIIVGTEYWADRVYPLRKGRVTLSLARGEKKFPDPHLWFDLKRVRLLVEDFLEYLKDQKLQNYSFYKKRAEKFFEELEKVRQEYKNLCACKYKEIYILGHPVFGYLLEDAGINQITLIKGHHKEGEPSIKRLTKILEGVQHHENKIVFLTDPEFERYRNYFESKGIKVIKLWSGGTYYMPGTYIELLRYNLENIKKALSCKN